MSLFPWAFLTYIPPMRFFGMHEYYVHDDFYKLSFKWVFQHYTQIIPKLHRKKSVFSNDLQRDKKNIDTCQDNFITKKSIEMWV